MNQDREPSIGSASAVRLDKFPSATFTACSRRNGEFGEVVTDCEEIANRPVVGIDRDENCPDLWPRIEEFW